MRQSLTCKYKISDKILENRSLYFTASNLGGIDPEKLSRATLTRARQTWICTTWPSFHLSLTVHYKYTETSRFTPVFIHKNSFELFLSARFLFWEFINVNLTFAVNVAALFLSPRTISKPRTGYRKRNWISLIKKKSLGPLTRWPRPLNEGERWTHDSFTVFKK